MRVRVAAPPRVVRRGRGSTKDAAHVEVCSKPRVVDASSRRFAKTARTLRGPRWRSRRAASRACSRLPCLCRRSHPWRPRTRAPLRASSSPRGSAARFARSTKTFRGTSLTRGTERRATWRSGRQLTAATSDALAAAANSSLPLAPRVLGTPLVVTMNPAMLARNPVVVATAARPHVAARRASAATVRQADGLVSRASLGSARRATRCAASESEADKTVSALDAILAGSQDDPAPEEVRERVSAPNTHSGCSPFSVSLPCLIREDARYASSHLVFPSARGDAASLLSPSRRSFPKRTRAGSRARGHRPSLDTRRREPSHRLDSFSRHFSNDDRNSPRRRRRANASPAR